MTASGTPQWQKFPPETLRRLLDAVDVDDVVDAHVALPEPIVPACTDDAMRRCYALCLQLWEDGFTRAELLRLIDKLLRGERLVEDEQARYKHIRACYKLLRFAQRLYVKQHKADYLFDLTTRMLGHLQDGFRNERRSAIILYSLVLRLLLAKPVWTRIQRALEHVQLDDAAGFVTYRQAQIRCLKGMLAHANYTGDEFHDTRKIVSQQVAHYGTLNTLEPSEDAYKMARFLAAINGLMGARHDEMVADAITGRQAYRTPMPLAARTRSLLETLVAHYPL